MITAALLMIFLLLWIFLSHSRKGRAYGKDFDLMDGQEFEYYCAGLLRKRGFQEVEVTRAAGPAVEAAKKLKILLWDRGYLESMEAECE